METKNDFEKILNESKHLFVKQVYEGWENLGFETRNKYRIFDAHNNQVAYAAEKNTGWLGAIVRHFLKHWRSFEINIYDHNRVQLYVAKFPFRWFFKTLYLHEKNGKLCGHLQQRFAVFHKKFDVFDFRGKQIAQIKSPLFKMWTFELKSGPRHLGTISKKWSGFFSEVFTDKDTFQIEFKDGIDANTRALMIATTLMVDIEYFENNKTTVVNLFD